MSAGICIMNKFGLALAADSACTVTISGKRAVYNTSRKLCPITESIAAIHYGNAMYMGVPIGIIFGLFAKHLEGKRFDHLREYADEFIHFLAEKAQMLFPENEGNYLENQVYQLFDWLNDIHDELLEKAKETNEDDKARTEANAAQEAIKKLHDKLKQMIGFYTKQERYQDDDDPLTEEENREFLNIMHNWGSKICPWLPRDEEILDIMGDLDELLKTDYLDDDIFTGICFAGFGEKDLYPAALHIKTDGWYSDQVRYNVEDDISINSESDAMILPLAQKDVMETILYGISDDSLRALRYAMKKNKETAIEAASKMFRSEKRKKEITGLMENTFKKVEEQYSELLYKEFDKTFLPATSFLAPEDMAGFAESMIRLTSMRRSIVVDDDSATVGGPVDVAIITKCDGFRWVKNKEGV